MFVFLKKNQNASRPSEHPPVRGGNVKTFRWDQSLQIQNLFMAFKRVPRWKNVFVLFVVSCPCMAINVSVQHNGEFLPGITPLTQCYYHR